MSKKNLNADGLLNELKGGSSFFPSKPEEPVAELPQIPPPPLRETHLPTKTTREASNQASLHASNHARKHASTLARPSDMIELIRKIVKNPAKEEVLYVRLTREEKNHLSDIAYTYERLGRKTTANEIGRIAVNFLIADFKANGEQSVLAKVIEELKA
jgi:hypothetical protein